MKDKSLQRIYIGLLLLASIMCIGLSGFMLIEGFSFTEAFYMTVITMATVGFEEVRPLSTAGMWFTAWLIIFSFGIFAYVISTFTTFVLDGEFRTRYRIYKMNQQLAKLQNHVIICGYGRNGSQAVTDLLQHNEQVLLIEKRQLTDDHNTSNPLFVHLAGDATQDETLQRGHIDKAKALITALPSDADNLLIVLTARSMNNAITIISRASDATSESKLKRAGANNVIMPDKVGGTRMAKLVSQPDIEEFVQHIMLRSADGVSLAEIDCNQMFDEHIGKTIGQLNIRSLTGANLIGMKREDGMYIFNPSPDITIDTRQKLFALGTPQQIVKLKAILKGK